MFWSLDGPDSGPGTRMATWSWYLGNRSLVADISSADKYSLTYYQNHVIEQLDKAQIIYQSAWFILGEENFTAAFTLAKTAFSQGQVEYSSNSKMGSYQGCFTVQMTFWPILGQESKLTWQIKYCLFDPLKHPSHDLGLKFNQKRQGLRV